MKQQSTIYINELTDQQANALIDQYLRESSYRAWDDVPAEKRDEILYEQLRLEEEYNRYVKHDMHE